MNRRIVRMALVFTVGWSLATATIAAARGATVLQVRGAGLTAEFSNQSDDPNLPPGDYFGALLGAGQSIGRGDGAFVNNSLCLNVDETRLHEDRTWSLERSYSACGPIAALSVRGDLGTAHLVASFAATCEQYRGPTWDCGQMDIDLTMRGVGPTTTYHEVTVSGAGGPGRSITRASGSSRGAVFASGHVTLGDRSFTSDGAVVTQAWLFDLQRGTVTIGG